MNADVDSSAIERAQRGETGDSAFDIHFTRPWFFPDRREQRSADRHAVRWIGDGETLRRIEAVRRTLFSLPVPICKVGKGVHVNVDRVARAVGAGLIEATKRSVGRTETPESNGDAEELRFFFGERDADDTSHLHVTVVRPLCLHDDLNRLIGFGITVRVELDRECARQLIGIGEQILVKPSIRTPIDLDLDVIDLVEPRFGRQREHQHRRRVLRATHQRDAHHDRERQERTQPRSHVRSGNRRGPHPG